MAVGRFFTSLRLFLSLALSLQPTRYRRRSTVAPLVATVAAFVASALCGSCTALQPRAERTRFLMLAPASAAGSNGPASSATTLVIGLGPVQLPAYLDRQEFVIRTSPNAFDLSDRYRWAEPLADNFRAVLGSDIRSQLGGNVIGYPWYAGTKLDYIVRVQVEQFDSDTDGTAALTARWQLRAAKPNQELISRESQFTHKATSSGGDAAAAALSADIADLGQQIASAVEQAQQQRYARDGSG
jgi:uncharacterized lipoprotein YmbA